MRWSALLVAMAVMAGCATPGDQGPLVAGDDGDEPSRTEAALADVWGHLLAVREANGWPAELAPYLVEAAVASGQDPAAWPAGGPLLGEVGWPPEDAPYMATLRPLHAVALAADGDGEKLVEVRARVLAGFDGAQFGEPALVNDDAFALVVLGAAAADEQTWAEVDPAIRNLLDNRSADGGWSWAVGGPAETDMTGLVLHGLSRAGAVDGVDPTAVLAFLATTRAAEGGHALRAGGEANCDSTVWAIRAQAEFGVAASNETWRFLFGLQDDSGGFAYMPGGPVNALCTAEAATLLGLLVHGDVPAPSGLDGAHERIG